MLAKAFFITGVSSDLGRAPATKALAVGHRVLGTVPSEAFRTGFEGLAPGRRLGKAPGVTDVAATPVVAAEVETQIGPGDVLVNNAGYGHQGTVGESPLEDLRKEFEVNVFGAIAVIGAVPPCTRQRHQGDILNATSMELRVRFDRGDKFVLPRISYPSNVDSSGHRFFNSQRFRTNRMSRTIYNYDTYPPEYRPFAMLENLPGI